MPDGDHSLGEWMSMDYINPNALKVVDVLGTWLLRSLMGSGAMHMLPSCAAMKFSPVLGMSKIISFERLCRALAHLAPTSPKYGNKEERAARATQLARAWMDEALGERSGIFTHVLDTRC